MQSGSQTFGLLVKQYIKTHDLSYQDMADRLEYRSKTSVARIAQDATSFDLRAEFYERFSRTYPLTSDERETFETLLRVSQLDESQQPLFLACRQMFYPKRTHTAVSVINADGHAQELDALLRQRCRPAASVTVIAFGWCSLSALRRIRSTLNDLNLTFHIRHVLYEPCDELRLAGLIAQTAPFLFDGRYTLNSIPPQENAAHLDSLFLIHYDRPDGSAEDDLLLQLSADQLLFQPLGGGLLCSAVRSLLEGLNTRPLKTGSAPRNHFEQAQQLVEHQRRCLALEEDQAVYSYCKDPDLSLIPPEIFKSAAVWGGPSDVVPEPLYRELCAIQQKRYQNLHTKRSPSSFILSRDAVKNFIWSGRLHNHPFLLRAFTPRERSEIIADLLDKTAGNPFFSIRLAAEEMPQLWNTISFLCTRPMTRASAHSRSSRANALMLQPASQPADGCDSLVLDQPGLASAFITYYQEELWAVHTLPQKASIDLIHTLLQYHAARFGG